MGQLKNIPFVVFESEMARMQRRTKGIALLAAAVSALLVANVLCFFRRD